jgi:hypothetical protein
MLEKFPLLGSLAPSAMVDGKEFVGKVNLIGSDGIEPSNSRELRNQTGRRNVEDG